jgi:DNA-binding transcriptional ArsR family regulator
MTEQSITPAIQWEFGTAYEFFLNLHVLHEPEYYGVPASWAAGVRSRIPAADRKLLDDVYTLVGVPILWIHSLPPPRDAISALWALKQIPPAERMIKLLRVDESLEFDNAEHAEQHRQLNAALIRIAKTHTWKTEDTEFLIKIWGKKRLSLKRDAAERALLWWSRPEEFGDGFLSALQSYYQAFFEEEEKRVVPVLQAGLERAKSLAATMTFDELFAELSQGVQLGDEFRAANFIFAPAFCTTPLIFFEKPQADTQLIIFGVRPANMSVIPGETVPDGLVRSLKALADPTRLKILFYLSQQECLTPSELARRLHLRAPTVTHHLSELRLASLVELCVEGDEKYYYAVRTQALDATFENLKAFLHSEPPTELIEKE